MGSSVAVPKSSNGGGQGRELSPKNNTKTRGTTTTQQNHSNTDADVMISYSHHDMDMMRKLRDVLQDKGLKVWVDELSLGAGVEFLSQIGKAIVDSKSFLILLSEDSVQSKYCNDELALAYISDKPIYPVCVSKKDDLIKLMSFGMKLTLAQIPWTYFTSTADDTEQQKILDSLFQSMISCIDRQNTQTMSNSVAPSTACNSGSHQVGGRKNGLNRQISFYSPILDTDPALSFWDSNFTGRSQVSWKEFSDAMVTDIVNTKLASLIRSEDSRDTILEIVHHELDDLKPPFITDTQFKEFCTVDGCSVQFWDRVEEETVTHFTMKNVFNMESTVRLVAIENLAKIDKPAVREALLDLLQDSSANVRAIAVISLAKTNICEDVSVYKMMRLLTDKDRLVRQSACLALGHVKATQAVSQLVSLWRNDVISTVREAAQLALEKIGGEEARTAVHMTKVLQEEIRKLSK